MTHSVEDSHCLDEHLLDRQWWWWACACHEPSSTTSVQPLPSAATGGNTDWRKVSTWSLKQGCSMLQYLCCPPGPFEGLMQSSRVLMHASSQSSPSKQQMFYALHLSSCFHWASALPALRPGLHLAASSLPKRPIKSLLDSPGAVALHHSSWGSPPGPAQMYKSAYQTFSVLNS